VSRPARSAAWFESGKLQSTRKAQRRLQEKPRAPKTRTPSPAREVTRRSWCWLRGLSPLPRLEAGIFADFWAVRGLDGEGRHCKGWELGRYGAAIGRPLLVLGSLWIEELFSYWRSSSSWRVRLALNYKAEKSSGVLQRSLTSTNRAFPFRFEVTCCMLARSLLMRSSCEPAEGGTQVARVPERQSAW
jgi:hypothetical protein